MFSKLFKIALALIILIIAAIAILLWNINPILESLKPKIAKTISEQIKEEVELGEISAQFFPNIAIKIENVGLKNKKEQASIGSLILDTSLGDLLKGSINVKQISLQSVNIRLTREKSGAFSLAGIKLTEQKKVATKDQVAVDKEAVDQGTDLSTQEKVIPAKEKQQAASSVPNSDNKTSLALEISKVTAENLNLYFIDEAVEPRQEIALTNASFEATGLSTSGSGNFSFVADFLSKKAGNLRITAESSDKKTALGLPQAKFQLVFSEIDLEKVNLLSSTYGMSVAGLDLKESLTLSLDASTSDQGFSVNTSLNADKSAIKFAQALIKNSGLPLSVELSAQPKINGTAEVSKFLFKIADVSLSGTASLGSTNVKANITSLKIPLASLGEFLPIAKNFSLAGEISGNATSALEMNTATLPKVNAELALKNIAADLGATKLADLSGNLKIANSDGINNIINLDLEPAKLSSITFGPSIVRANLSEKSFDLSKLNLKVFEGELSGTANLVTPLAPGNFSSNFIISNLNLAKFSETLFPKSPYQLKGTLNELSANPKANLQSGLLETLTLNSKFLATGGSIAGTNILKQTLEKVDSIPGVQSALIKYVPEEILALLEKKETAFDKIEASTSIASKTININSLSLTHSAYEISGTGTLTFESACNIKAKLILSASASEKIAQKEAKTKLLFDEQNRITIPILISKSPTGTPIVVPDLGDLTKRALKNTAKEAISKELEKRGGLPVGDKANKLLKSLF